MMNMKKFFQFHWLHRISPGYHAKVQSRRKQMAFQAEFFRRWELAQETMRREYENLHAVSRRHEQSLQELRRQIQEISRTAGENAAAQNNALAEIRKNIAAQQNDSLENIADIKSEFKQLNDKLVFIGNRTHFFDDILKNLKDAADTQNALRQNAALLAQGQKEMTDKLVFIGNRTHFFDDITGRLQSLEQIRQTLHQQYESLFRNEIRIRWQMLDALEPLLFPPDMQLTCPICGHADARKNYQTAASMCQFSGGLLERFVCPDCGVIFGPLKMMMLKPGQLAEEYRQSYTTYSESDCTALEENIFRDLNPVKDGVYLNYGAGAWNSTSEKLRQEGFTVYDYEPFAPAADRDNLIRNPEQLRGMKFDGIFSNDLLEHLPDPVKELKFMSSMLKPGGCMIHGSGCYEYAFEYTRFHLFFFVGRSLGYISRDAGLKYSLGERVYSYSPFRKCKFTLN